MVPLEKETSIEVLRSVSLWLRERLEETLKENAELKNEKEAAKQDWLHEALRDQILKLQERFYGRGRESLEVNDRAIGQSESAQLTLHADHENRVGDEEHEAENSASFPVADDLSYVYKMSERELATESLMRGLQGGAKAWEEIPRLTQDSYEITILERIIRKVRHSQAKYRLKREFNTTGKEVILTARGPAKLKAGCQYSIDFAATVAIDKYLYHMPLERQRRKMESQGLKVNVKTLYGLCEAVAEHCNAVVPMIKKEILSDFTAAHLDETPWHIVGSDQTCYMWALSNRIGSYYQFEPTRSGLVAEEILKGHEGSVVTDGFSGYNRVKRNEKIRVQQCWSHVRREFFDIYKNYPTEVTEIVKLIDDMMKIEHEAKSFAELAELRKTKSKPLTEKILKWLIEQRPKHLPGSGMVKAIDYALGCWSELTQFLKDLSVPLTNNDAERALRHIVMGRKNFNGSKTINGADVAASIYTVIESAKRAGQEPGDYLRYLIDARWFKDELKTPQQLAAEKARKRKSAPTVFPPKDQWRIE
jgi:transposase